MKENSIEEDIKLAEEEKKAIESFKQENENDLSRFEDFNDYTQTLIKRNKTILNLIQKQQAELGYKEKIIEYWKNGFERELESNRENVIEIIKKDKIIDKMAFLIDGIFNSKQN